MFDKAPPVPDAGPAAIAMPNEKLLADLLFLGDPISLRAMNVPSNCSLPNTVRPKNPQDAWGLFRSACIGIFGQPDSIRMHGGGEWGNGVRADLRSGRRIRLESQ